MENKEKKALSPINQIATDMKNIGTTCQKLLRNIDMRLLLSENDIEATYSDATTALFCCKRLKREVKKMCELARKNIDLREEDIRNHIDKDICCTYMTDEDDEED